MKPVNYHRFITLLIIASTFGFLNAQGTIPIPAGKNLANVASVSTSFRAATVLTTINDGMIPNNTGPVRAGGGGGNRPQQRPSTALWVQYEWNQPVNTKEVSVFWWNFENSVKLPLAYSVQYWDGNNFVPVTHTIQIVAK